jgi:AraC-like DNA-binding protein
MRDRGEEITFASASGLPGVMTMRVKRSPRLWRTAHETYSLCNTLPLLPSLGRWADWTYRGQTHRAHAYLTMIMEPGEVHCNTRIDGLLSFEVLFLQANAVETHARELGARGTPHFALAQVDDREAYRAIARFIKSVHDSETALSQQSLLAHCLRLLLGRHAEHPTVCRIRSEHVAVRRVRDYLHDRLTDNVLLNDLVELTGVSRFHLSRAFARAFGVPPHEYHLLARVERAREMLERGGQPADVATELGFADQSHLGRHFRRIVGVTPGQYAAVTRATARTF